MEHNQFQINTALDQDIIDLAKSMVQWSKTADFSKPIIANFIVEVRLSYALLRALGEPVD